MKTPFVLIAIVAFAFPSGALATPDHTGSVALGYFNPDAPIGVRYQVSQKTGLDLGIGFAQEQIADDPTTVPAGDEKKNLQLNVEAGVPFTLVQRERVNFFVRPGVLFKFIPTYNRATPADAYSKKSQTEVHVTGILGVEWFVTDEFSLSVGHGIEIVSSKGVVANQLTTGNPETTTLINGLQALDITRIGFHFYF